MKRMKWIAAGSIVFIAASGSLWAAPSPPSAIRGGHQQHKRLADAASRHAATRHQGHVNAGAMRTDGPVLELKDVHGKQLPALAEALEKALVAVKAGKHEEAVKKLTDAQKTLAAIRKTVAMHVQPKVVNTVCPIMGGKVNADNLKPELTRTFEGKTIGFCCGACPGTWDKLTDEQRDERLAKLNEKN